MTGLIIESLIADENLKGWIFDLDGVITDTARFHYQAWKKLADEENLTFDEDINERLRGVSRRASLEIILNGHTVHEKAMSDMMNRKNAYYCEYLEDLTRDDILPGIMALLNLLKEKQKKLAIGSASRNTEFILGHLGITHLFDGIASGAFVKRAKPAPDIFVHAAGQLGLPVSQCIVLEDAEAGVSGALEAGFITIGIGPRERVGHADYRFETTTSIL